MAVCMQGIVTRNQSQSPIDWTGMKQEERLLVYQVNTTLQHV